MYGNDTFVTKMNAKELQLSKLNATTKTIGMYLYGIAIGMDFQDIASIMMSNVGYAITDAMEGNSFTNEQGAFSIDSVFDYYEVGPRNIFKLYEKPILTEILNPKNNKVEKGNAKNNPSYALSEVLKTHYDAPKTSGYLLLARLAWEKSTLENKFNQLDAYYVAASKLIKAEIMNVEEATRQTQLLAQLIDKAKSYVRTVQTLKYNSEIYNSIKTLSVGAQEMRMVGAILSLNQGLKTKQDEIFSGISKILNSIVDMDQLALNEKYRKQLRYSYEHPDKKTFIKKKTSGILPFDIVSFCFDPEYKALIILDYDLVKHTFNILDCVSNVPNFDGYLQSDGLAFAAGSATSSKFRFAYEEGNKVARYLGIKGTNDMAALYKGMQNFFSDRVRDFWLLSEEVTFPWNENFIFSRGRRVPISDATSIKLGTNDGNAAFKYWVENTFIPTLLNFGDPSISENLFIKNLTPAVLSKTVSHNSILYYTAPINMMPKTDAERSIFNNYKAALNKLSTKEALKVDGKSYSISDVFFLYGLIAHYGKPGEQSIMPLFENLHKLSIAFEFHRYESAFSNRAGFMLNRDFTINDIEPYVIPVSSPYRSFSSVIFAEDPDSMRIVKWRKLGFDETPTSRAISGYERVNSSLLDNTVENFYMSGRANDVNETSYADIITLNTQDGEIECIYDVRLLFDKTTSISFTINGKETFINLEKYPDLLNLPFELIESRETGEFEKLINKDYIKSAIEQVINCG